MEKSVSGALNVLFCTQPESTPTCGDAVESASFFRLTDLPPLTYPLIIEE